MMNVQSLSPDEWDFSKLDDASTDELTRCQAYEYARESPVLRDLSPSAQRLGMHGLFYSEERPSWLRSFYDQIGADYIRPKLVMFALFCEEFPETPWLAMSDSAKQQLRVFSRSTKPFRLAALDELALLQAEGESLKKRSFITFEEPPSKEVQDMVIAPTYDSPRGQLVFGVSINLRESRDCDILNQFKKQLAELRMDLEIDEPKVRESGRTSGKGRGLTDRDVRDSLFKLGIMRILNRCNLDDVWLNYPDAWAQWQKRYPQLGAVSHNVKCDADTRREIVTLSRRSVATTFHTLFPFENAKPIHYALAKKGRSA
jgi:hypothetical protein